MKKYLVIWGLLAFAVMAKADASFLKTLPADDFANAGLQKLTPEELARLEALVERYKTGEVAVVRQQAEVEATAAQKVADKKILAAETKAREAAIKTKEIETKAAAVPAKKQPGWFTALVTLNHASQKPEKEEPLESRLAGDFRGWNGSSIFKLEDGTQWVQQNKTDVYAYSPTLHSPKVKISPAAIRGFWLEIEGVNLQVRVVPFQLPDAPPAKEP